MGKMETSIFVPLMGWYFPHLLSYSSVEICLHTLSKIVLNIFNHLTFSANLNIEFADSALFEFKVPNLGENKKKGNICKRI
jgi:hypothetical protein